MHEHDESTKGALDELMRSNKLAPDTRLYRASLPDYLKESATAGVSRVSANEKPSEAVTDVYRNGHLINAEHIGPGLAFAESRDLEWSAPERKVIELALKDVLDQGGLIYPVESVTTERVWYVTLPDGDVQVRVID